MQSQSHKTAQSKETSPVFFFYPSRFAFEIILTLFLQIKWLCLILHPYKVFVSAHFNSGVLRAKIFSSARVKTSFKVKLCDRENVEKRQPQITEGVIKIVKQNQQHSVVITDDAIFCDDSHLLIWWPKQNEIEFFKITFPKDFNIELSTKAFVWICCFLRQKKTSSLFEKEQWILETFQFLKVGTITILFENVLKSFFKANCFSFW